MLNLGVKFNKNVYDSKKIFLRYFKVIKTVW